MKFWNYVSEHATEIALIVIVIFTIVSMPIAFLCERPVQKVDSHITFDSTQVLNVKLVNDSCYVVQ